MILPAKKVLSLFYLILFIAIVYFFWNRDGQIRLIVRGDDMGFSHAVNVGCIKSYQEGILTAVEVMVPGPAFLEAVDLLKQNPGLDVGIHLTLTSEWENIKWGPITRAPSLVDENGHFFPMTWPDEAYPPHRALGTAQWNSDEIERELRAQIELILFHIPQCSHATPHMGFNSISDQVNQLAFSLIKEYNINANIRLFPLKEISLFEGAMTEEKMISNAINVLENIGSGTWQFYEHPGMIIEGVENHWHIGAEDDAQYRHAVTKALVSRQLQEVIKKRNIKLIGYRDLKIWQ
jgi:predicted glycoside hydrolase/deacetylase ChbG (UPF0249 family)